MAAQSFLFLAAGSDPVASVASFCMYALAANNGVQKKLQQEVEAVLKQHDGKWTYEAVKDMKYLDQVISGKYLDLVINNKYREFKVQLRNNNRNDK